MKPMNISRRKFIRNAGTAAMLTPFIPSPVGAMDQYRLDEPLKVHLFSKHLQFLDVKKAGQIAAELGFDGLDLTVRPNGHILPENVKTELLPALKDIKQSGSSCAMITTTVSDAANPMDQDIIKTAAAGGVRFYRSNWFKFREDRSLEDSLLFYQEKVRQLADLNKTHNIIGCYQNHSGTYIGASVWEVKKILETANPEFFGVQYDIRHAVVEGGGSWTNGVKLLKDQIRTIVLKDFKWGKVDGKWQIINVPMGQGMVDFTSYFKLLKSYGIKPPVTLHLEYPLGGAEKGRYEIDVDQKIVFDAMKKDLATVHQLWKDA